MAAGGRASYLNAARVEAGVLAEVAQNGDLGGTVLHQFHEDDACGILLLEHLHSVLQLVLQKAIHTSGQGFPKCWKDHCLTGL